MDRNTKRKNLKSSSTSSTEENFSPNDKRIKHNVSFTHSEPSSESDEVLTLLIVAETVNVGTDYACITQSHSLILTTCIYDPHFTLVNNIVYTCEFVNFLIYYY